MSRATFMFCLSILIFCIFSNSVVAQESTPGIKPLTAMPNVIAVPAEAHPSANFNVEAATDAYLAKIPADARARSDAYFEGGYWLILWDFLYGAALALLLLSLRWSSRMRSRRSRGSTCISRRDTCIRPLRRSLVMKKGISSRFSSCLCWRSGCSMSRDDCAVPPRGCYRWSLADRLWRGR